MINSRGKGVVATPLTVFSGRSKTLKKVTKGIKVISFTSFAVIFMKKKWRYHLARGRVSRQSQRVRGGGGIFFSVFGHLIRHFEQYLHTMKLKLTKYVGITTFLLYKQKIR